MERNNLKKIASDAVSLGKRLFSLIPVKNFSSLSTISLVLTGCGKGSEKNISETYQNETHNIDYSNGNSQNLNYYSSVRLHHYEVEYAAQDKLPKFSYDQSKSENYLSEFKGITSTKKLSGHNAIDGLLFPSNEDTTKTAYWDTNTTENTISFSFFDPNLALLDEANYSAGPDYLRIYNNGFHEITEAQKIAIREALGEIQKVINIQFVEVIEQNNEVGTLRFGISQDSLGSAYAQAVPPGSYWAADGDIWFERAFHNLDLSKGNYEFRTILHETGHALGLSHPHEGGAQILKSYLNSRNFTQMSYEDPTWAYFKNNYTISETLMVYDIQALQYLYGANETYNIGNTRYQFDDAKPISISIWDAGGEDIIDLSNFSIGCDVNIDDGAYSTINYSGWNAKNNFGIAFDCFIENVSGSQGSDIIRGNELNNELLGNGGDDIMYGGPGNDIFDWKTDSRSGNDTMYGGLGDDVFVSGQYSSDTIIEYMDQGHDTVYVEMQGTYQLPDNVEEVRGLGMSPLTLIGNSLNNTMRGSSGNDILSGGVGADDFLLYLGMGEDVVLDFNTLEGDEVLLAFGLEKYQVTESELGILYTLTDGSSLQLYYDTTV